MDIDVNDKIKNLQEMINESQKIVVFSGAGVSTESGIKDFRSDDGLYNMNYKYPPELILSHDFFIKNTQEFYEFYRDKLNCLDAQPNVFHNYLKTLEDRGKLLAIVTQNIDGLHSKAGVKNVYELHGTIYKNKCINCGKDYSADVIFNSINIPKCTCGGIIKPNVVLYNELLNEKIINNSIKSINQADMLIIAGTSLTVYPASGFINYFHGKYLVIINKDSTNYDKRATLLIRDKLGNIFKYLK